MSQKGTQIGKTSPQQNLELGPFCWEKTSANGAPELRFLFGSLNYVIEVLGLLQGTLESYLFASCCVDCSKTNFKIQPDCPPGSNLKLGAWGLELGGWSLELEAWSLKLGVCSLEVGACSLELEVSESGSINHDWWLVIGWWLGNQGAKTIGPWTIGPECLNIGMVMNHNARFFNY